MRISKTLRAAAVTAAAVLAAGCQDVIGGTRLGATVYGVDIRDGAGNLLVSVDSRRIVSGSLTVPQNGSRQLQVSLRDRNGGVLQLEAGEAISVNVINGTLVAWQPGAVQGGVQSGTLAGRSKGTGTTHIRVGFLEGVLISYESPSIQLTVN